MFKKLMIAALFLGASTPALSQIVVDGSRDPGYGAIDATVVGDLTAPVGNFQAPTNRATVGYTISLTREAQDVYGFMASSDLAALPFSNVYFDLDPATRSGSDLGFELGVNNSARAFIPGVAGSVVLTGVTTAFAPGSGFEFAIPISFFTSPIAGLSYNPALTFSGTARLNLSQSLSYSVAGGAASYGADRLGVVDVSNAVGAVPEPATWAMMIIGFGAVGSTLRRSRRANALDHLQAA